MRIGSNDPSVSAKSTEHPASETTPVEPGGISNPPTFTHSVYPERVEPSTTDFVNGLSPGQVAQRAASPESVAKELDSRYPGVWSVARSVVVSDLSILEARALMTNSYEQSNTPVEPVGRSNPPVENRRELGVDEADQLGTLLGEFLSDRDRALLARTPQALLPFASDQVLRALAQALSPQAVRSIAR